MPMVLFNLLSIDSFLYLSMEFMFIREQTINNNKHAAERRLLVSIIH